MGSVQRGDVSCSLEFPPASISDGDEANLVMTNVAMMTHGSLFPWGSGHSPVVFLPFPPHPAPQDRNELEHATGNLT